MPAHWPAGGGFSLRARVSGFVVSLLLIVPVALGLGFGLSIERGHLSSSQSQAIVDQPAFGAVGEKLVVEEVRMTEAAMSYRPPSSLDVLEIVPTKAATPESISAVADVLGIDEERQYDAEGVSDARSWIHFPRKEDADCFLMCDRYAVAELEDMFSQGAKIELPGPEEARGIADKTLESLGLLEGVRYQGTSPSHSITQSKIGQPDRTSDLALGVWYEAEVDGLPIVGPGARVHVVVGPEGDVIEVHHYAQAARPAGRVQLRQVDAAIADMKTGGGIPPATATIDSVRVVGVEKVQLGYYAAPLPMGISDYKPVYLIRVRLADGTLGEWVVSAYSEGSHLIR